MSRFLIFLMALGLHVTSAQSAQLVSDLSTNEVAIGTDFTGENILLFGAIEKNRDAQQDIIVIIKGPPQSLTVRRKEKHFGIWINGGQKDFAAAPSYYAIASTRRLDRITIPAELERHAAGLSFLPVTFADAEKPGQDNADLRSATNCQLGCIMRFTGRQTHDGRLFRARIACRRAWSGLSGGSCCLKTGY